MGDDLFIVCEPLLDAQELLLGYELAGCQSRAGQASPDERNQLALVRAVLSSAGETASGALSSKHTLFLEASPALLSHEILHELPAKSTVLALQAAEIADASVLAAVKATRECGFGISLRGVDFANLNREVLAAATHVELCADSDFPSRVRLLHDLGVPGLQPIARRVASWEDFSVCTKLGAHVFAGSLHLSERTDGNRSSELNPSQKLILRLMDMVRRNCDVRELEAVLKYDPVLAYKLLRFINSAGMGLGCEVQSLRHAVALLGYAPLYRWLALLLATATTAGFPPIMLHMAILRGRFAERLGQHFLPNSEAENLFVTGMFSLLDKLLGVPMECVLEKVPLSESITQALLTREGMYGPFLAMAEACELNSADVRKVAMSLCINAGQVNEAHLSALIWALGMDL